MTENRDEWNRVKSIKNPAGLTTGEKDKGLPYHPPETPCGLEKVRKVGMKLAQGHPDGDKKETSKQKVY
jgi:hypothetical protein